jgi:Flp pilus assembly protein TadG
VKNRFTLRRLRGDKGQGLVEMALVLPIFLLLVMGIVDFGMGMRAYVTVNNSSREGARYAIVCPSILDDDAIKARVANYSNGLVTTGNVFVTWQSQRCKSGESVKVVATTNYQYITPLSAFMPNPLRLTASSTMRVE